MEYPNEDTTVDGPDRRMTGDPGLVLSHGTLRYADFPDRLAAASSAGFASIGLTVNEYRTLRARGWTDQLMLDALSSWGLSISEVELIVGFAGLPGHANIAERPGLVYADPAMEADAFHMADVFGISHLQAIGRFESGPPSQDTVPKFAALCDRAAEHGLRIALEFVPYTNIPDLRTASDIVKAAGRANGGICVDSWHFFRGDPDFDTLRSIAPEHIMMIQINDGPAVPANPNRVADAVEGRVCPGEGDFDLPRFLDGLWGIGAGVDLSVEIFSTELQRLTAGQAAERAARATRNLVETVRGDVGT